MNWKRGEFFVWITATAVTMTILMAATLLMVIVVNGMGYLWPSALVRLTLKEGPPVLGEFIEREPVHEGEGHRGLYKTGNRRLYGVDFRWVPETQVLERSQPNDAITVERVEHGNFYGFLQGLQLTSLGDPQAEAPAARLAQAVADAHGILGQYANRQQELSDLADRIEALRIEERGLSRKGVAPEDPRRRAMQAEVVSLQAEFDRLNVTIARDVSRLRENAARFTAVGGEPVEIPLLDIVRFYQPNTMSVLAKAGHYAVKLWELFTEEPRESNTEGGLFPAIFGTVMLVILMSLFAVPLGVVAAIYLHEYAREGLLVRLVRIAVYNLAGVPSIVFGIFGLGFFVYGIGSSIDQIFFADQLPSPTFGTGGILWSSLTLALLTVPVVVVATEEGLSSIPRGMREASLALGGTQFQTIMRVVMPMAAPGIVTGLILAMARAAGEVAPLMITGVVKLAPSLPLDGEFPYLHLDRKFMHLGFHIYDVGFQSPNVEAAKPMVYVTTLLLVVIVLLLSMTGIYLRNNMRKRFQGATF